MNNELGSNQQATLGDTDPRSDFHILDEHRADIDMNINGYRIECRTYETITRVTIDGREFACTFIEAMQYAAKLPVRWNRLDF